MTLFSSTINTSRELTTKTLRKSDLAATSHNSAFVPIPTQVLKYSKDYTKLRLNIHTLQRSCPRAVNRERVANEAPQTPEPPSKNQPLSSRAVHAHVRNAVLRHAKCHGNRRKSSCHPREGRYLAASMQTGLPSAAA